MFILKHVTPDTAAKASGCRVRSSRDHWENALLTQLIIQYITNEIGKGYMKEICCRHTVFWGTLMSLWVGQGVTRVGILVSLFLSFCFYGLAGYGSQSVTAVYRCL